MSLDPEQHDSSAQPDSVADATLETSPVKQEVERKFLVDLGGLGLNLADFPSVVITQGYLAIDESGKEVRVRQKGEKHLLTVKGDGSLSRAEAEIAIGEEQFNELWPMTEGQRVSKTRYEIPHDGFTIELDVFSEDLSGLVVAEVEFADEAQSQQFHAPDWFGKEVTSDKRYKNKALAVKGKPQ